MKAYELYQKMAPELAQRQFLWMREEERKLYKTAINTLTEAKKLRPVFVTKKPVAEQIAWIQKNLSVARSNSVAEHLLQAYFMEAQKEMLVTFCDALEIQHDGSGTVQEELPEVLDAEKLGKAVDLLFDTFPANLTSLYLFVFNIQKEDGWPSLSRILAEDERITLK